MHAILLYTCLLMLYFNIILYPVLRLFVYCIICNQITIREEMNEKYPFLVGSRFHDTMKLMIIVNKKGRQFLAWGFSLWP